METETIDLPIELGSVTRIDLARMLENSMSSNPMSFHALVLVDMKSLHKINTTLGYAVGDRLIFSLCHKLKEELRKEDVVTVTGHSQLAVILPEVKNQNHALLAAKKIKRLTSNAAVDGRLLTLGPVLGVAVFPLHGHNSEKLVRAADIALKDAEAKNSDIEMGRGVEDDKSSDLDIAQALEKAISNGELELHFQPQIRMQDRLPVAVEALSRWNNEQFGSVPPDKFIPMAESLRLIKPLTTWSLNAALRALQRWGKIWPSCRMAVNLSASIIHDQEIVPLVERALNIWDCPADRLTLELTESAVMSDPSRSLQNLEALHELGVSLAIDDFGTGYSSLAYLSSLPIDELKIDKSFVLELASKPDNARIVRTVVNLAHSLRLSVTAEGIEDQQTLEMLNTLGCDFGQGYFISRPKCRTDIEAWYAATDRDATSDSAPEPEDVGS